VPRGWDVVRLPPDPAQERADDLEALANIVRDVNRAERAAAQGRPFGQPRPAATREPGRQQEPRQQEPRQPEPRQAGPRQAGPRQGGQAPEPVGQGVEVGRRGHLRVVRSAPQPEA